MADEVKVEITVEEKQAFDAINRLTKSIETFSKTTESGIKKTDMAWASFAGNLASNVITKSLSLVKDGFDLVVGSMSGAIDAASEQEDANNKLNTALALTGKYTKESSNDLQSFAGELQKTSKFSDDAIVSTSALIQSFAKLDNDGLKGATQAAADLASVLGVDIDTAATKMVSAVNGSGTALKKYGIEIKATGDNAKDMAEIVKQINSNFGGTAASQMNTFSGAMSLVKKAIGEGSEEMGNLIVQNPAVIGALKAVGTILFELSKFAEENRVALQGLVTKGVYFAIDAFEALSVAVQAANTIWSGFRNGIDLVLAAISIVNGAVFGVVEGLVKLTSVAGEFLGLDTSGINDMAQGMEDLRKSQFAAAEDYARQTVERSKNTEIQNAAIESFTSTSAERTRLMVDDQVSNYERDTNKYFEELNKKKTDQELHYSEMQLLAMGQAQYEAEQSELLKTNEQVKNDEKFQFLADNLGREEALRVTHDAKRLADQGKTEEASKKLSEATQKANQQRIFQTEQWEDISNKKRMENFKGTLGTIATLSSSSNSTLFAIGKAAAIGNATIDGVAAVQKALASAPPPFNFALAALVGVATAANIANIAAQQPPKFASGGIVGGGSYYGDMMQVQANSGEMLLNRNQQTKLFNDINGGGGGSEVVAAIHSLGDRISNMQIVVQANAREIARLVRDEKASGFSV